MSVQPSPARKPQCDTDLPLAEIHIVNDFKGLVSFLGDDAFSDITVRLPDGSSICSHRLLLAATSDVLKAKFLATFRDSHEHEWSPEVGSASTWHWILGWIYGHIKSLPLGNLVDALLIADQYQMKGLSAGLRAVPVADMAEAVAQQLLQAWAWPDILTTWARVCVPLAAASRSVWLQLWEARPYNVAVVIRFLPVLCEADRLRLCGEYLRRSQSSAGTLPPVFLDAVRWDSFPAATLDGAYHGDTSALEAVAGVRIEASEHLRRLMHEALASRCRFLESAGFGGGLEHPSTTMHAAAEHASAEMPLEWGYLADQGLDTVGPPMQRSPGPGLFARMAEKQLNVQVRLSSSHYLNGPDPLALLTPDTRFFGTDKQCAEDPPWIEILSESCVIRPVAIGLKHGWSDSDFCEHFVVEAALEEKRWETVLSHASRRLRPSGEVLPVQSKEACSPSPEEAPAAAAVASGSGDTAPSSGGQAEATRSRGASEIVPIGLQGFYDRFRIRMTGPNSSSNWYLMIAWFDVFGQFQTKRRLSDTSVGALGGSWDSGAAVPAIAVAQRRSTSGLQHFAV